MDKPFLRVMLNIMKLYDIKATDIIDDRYLSDNDKLELILYNKKPIETTGREVKELNGSNEPK